MDHVFMADRDGTPVMVVTTLAGLRRLFVPGRRSSPVQVRADNRQVIAASVRAIQVRLPEFLSGAPRLLVGIPIYTEGAGAPFIEAVDDVWPGQGVGGLASLYIHRDEKKGDTGPFVRYEAECWGADLKALTALPEPGIGLFFDIGASGATIEVAVREISATHQINRLIFASPCMSGQAVDAFARACREAGLVAGSYLCVANVGIFGMHHNSTFLSLQLPGAVTTVGALALSRLIYLRPEFCHIGAGGDAANVPTEYAAELARDEQEHGVVVPNFTSLQEAMARAGVSFSKSFRVKAEVN